MAHSQNHDSLISQYYDHWDGFVSDNFIANELCKNCKYLQKNLLPEPWWGWNNDNNTPLNSVVINYNPGLGDCVQCSNVIHRRYGRNFSYRGIMPDFRLHHRAGEQWHYKRASAIMSLIGGSAPTDTSSHLSIELYPFHSKNVQDVNKDVEKYLKDNYDDVIKNVFEFAACAASLIEGDLQNIVFVRISPKVFCYYLDKLNLKYEQLFKTKYFSCFKILNLTDDAHLKEVNFITASGVRNHFPKNEQAIDNFKEVWRRIKSNNQ